MDTTGITILTTLACMTLAAIMFALGYAMGLLHGRRWKSDEQKEYKIAVTSVEGDGILKGTATLDETFQQEKEDIEDFNSEFTQNETDEFNEKIFDDMMERLNDISHFKVP